MNQTESGMEGKRQRDRRTGFDRQKWREEGGVNERQ